MTQPSISVIVPTYNRADDLPGAVESILRQTVSVAEVIVVDDGSTDDTPEVIRALPGPVRGFRQPNQGPAAARNLGMREAVGDVVAFLDVDDRWDPKKSEVQLAVLEAHPEVGWCTSDLKAVDRGGVPRRDHRGLADLVPVFGDLGVSLEEWLGSRLERGSVRNGERLYTCFLGDAFGLLLHGNFVFPSATIIRRAVAEEVGPFDPHFRRTEDNDYFLRMARVAPMAAVTEQFVDYRTGESDAMTASRHADALIDEAMECIAVAVDRAGELSEYEERAYRRGRELLYRRQAYTRLSNLDRAGARAAIRGFWEDRGGPDLATVPLLLTTFVPDRGLRWMAKAKRIVSAARRR